MVSGGDYEAILQHLTSMINRNVGFYDYKKKALYSPSKNCDFCSQIRENPIDYCRKSFHSFPLELTGDFLGELFVDCPKDQPLSDNLVWPINYAKIALLLFIQKEIAIKESRLRYKDTFLQSLFFQQIHKKDDLEEMFGLLGEGLELGPVDISL